VGLVYYVSQPGPHGLGYLSTSTDVYEYHFKRGVNLDGKTIVITGGKKGIGREVVSYLARWNTKIWILTQHTNECETEIEKIKRETYNFNLRCQWLDLTYMDSIMSVAEVFEHEKVGKVDILIHNAAVMGVKQFKGVDDYEIHLATNHLGPFLLTKLLLSYLEKGAPSRVVTTTSNIHHVAEFNFKDYSGTIPGENRILEYGRPMLRARLRIFFSRVL